MDVVKNGNRIQVSKLSDGWVVTCCALDLSSMFYKFSDEKLSSIEQDIEMSSRSLLLDDSTGKDETLLSLKRLLSMSLVVKDLIDLGLDQR